MQPYSVDSGIRLKLAFILASLAFIIASCLSSILKDVSLNIATPSAFALFVGLCLIFDRWAWRWPLIRSTHGIPCIAGSWKGTMLWKDAGGSEKESTVTAIVEQTWSKIKFDVISNEARSTVRCASISDTESKRKTLLFVYDLRPRCGGVLIRADGCQELIIEKKLLEGSYFNSRHKQGGLRLEFEDE